MHMKEIEDANRKRMLDIIQRIPTGTPDGWEKMTFAVGGLMYIGFSNVYVEKLMVISSQGQCVIDCRTGRKSYCAENYDENDLVALAEELGDEIVPIAGEGGGGLRRCTQDGNALAMAAPFWPMEKIIFMPGYVSYVQHPEKCMVIFDDFEIKAFGFSKCGHYIAVCSSNTLSVFKKVVV